MDPITVTIALSTLLVFGQIVNPPDTQVTYLFIDGLPNALAFDVPNFGIIGNWPSSGNGSAEPAPLTAELRERHASWWIAL
jgi:hypothetical protein